MPSITPVDSGATLTDSLTGWGTIALAVVTFFTVLVTIHIANTDRRRDDKLREQEKRHRQKAQARLVIVEAPSPGLSLGEDENRYGLYFTIANHSQQPVMGVEAEVWMGAATLDQPCTSRGKLEDYVVMPLGHNNKLKVIVESLYLSPAWVPGESAGRTPMASSGTWMHNIQSHRPARPSPPVAGCGHEWAGPSGGAHGAGSVDR